MSRVFLILFISIKLFSCGYQAFIPTFSKDGYFDFIQSDITNPLFYNAYISSKAYEKRKKFYSKKKQELNLDEWSKYLQISKDEAYQILYKDTSPLMIKDKQKQKEFIAYKSSLKNIKEYDTNWKDVLKRFQKLYTKSKLDFFKTRIAYNIVRSYHHLKEYDKEIEFVNSLKRDNSIAWEWIDSFYAGAVKNRGNLVKAAYLFSKVFATHKSDAYIGYYDFEIKSDKQWQELLNMAKSKEQKTLFHFLRSLKNRFSMIKELEYMIKLDKDSIWTKRLLNMVAQRVQYYIYYLQKNTPLNKELSEDEKTEKMYITDFLNLLKKYHHDNFTNFLYAYFNALFYNKLIDIDLKEKQKEFINYIYYVKNLKKLDEKELSKKLKNIETLYKKEPDTIKALQGYTITIISNLYPKNSVQAIFSSHYIQEDIDEDNFDFRYSFRKWEDLKKVKEFLSKKDKTYIQKLLASSPANSYNEDFAKLSYSIFLTKQEKYKEALEIVKSLPPAPKDFSDIYDWDNKDRQRASKENPFNISLSGNNRTYHKNYFYPQTKFLKTMIKIKESLRKNPTSAMDNYLFATALYNISFYGNSPMFGKMYRSCSSLTSGSLESLPKAKKYYQNVLKYSKNKELLAKTYYQLMKIDFVETTLKLQQSGYKFKEYEEFRYGYSNNFKGFSKPIVKHSVEYKKHYNKLVKYKETRFYKKIRQCVVFEYFK